MAPLAPPPSSPAPGKAEWQKLNSQPAILVDKSHVVNPYIFLSDEEDANEVMEDEIDFIKEEIDEEIIMLIHSFFNRLSCVKEKSYINNTSNLQINALLD